MYLTIHLLSRHREWLPILSSQGLVIEVFHRKKLQKYKKKSNNYIYGLLTKCEVKMAGY